MQTTFLPIRTITYQEFCPHCLTHPQMKLVRVDFKARTPDPNRKIGGNSRVGRYKIPEFPQKPEAPGAPDPFLSRIHCERCNTSFDPSIITDNTKIIHDSAIEDYEKALQEYHTATLVKKAPRFEQPGGPSKTPEQPPQTAKDAVD